MVNSTKPVIFVVIVLLVVMLIYSSVAISPYSAFAAGKSPRDVCDLTPKSKCTCVNLLHLLKASCCSYTSEGNLIACEECDINLDTGDYEKCHDITAEKSPTTGQANPPQGGGAIEQPPTPKKHGGTTLPKGGGALERPQTGELTTKKGTNNDNSPTPPPPCPDKGPIPPNCTLKPKF
jgi:hypothetical protein